MNYDRRKSELRKITGVGVMFMAVTLVISVMLNGEANTGNTMIWAKDESNVQTVSDSENKNPDEIFDINTPGEETEGEKISAEPVKEGFKFDPEKFSENYIIVKKPDNRNGLASITDNYVYRTLFLDIEGSFEDFYSNNLIERVSGGERYEGNPEEVKLEPYLEAYLSGKPAENPKDESAFNEEKEYKKKSGKNVDPVINIRIGALKGDSERTRISLTCNRLYVPKLYEDEDNYYISLQRPKEVYDKIIVIDAGHGGKHPGTTSLDGKILEKDTTLKIVTFLKELFDKQDDIHVYYTRTDDSSVYLRPRAILANESEADFFVSIHNNAYFNEHAFGSEVFYNEKIKKGGIKSDRLAELILSGVTAALDSRSRGVRKGSEKYVLGHTKMPSALIEVGYLTNEGDLSYINDDNKMKECARAIYDAVLTAFREKKN